MEQINKQPSENALMLSAIENIKVALNIFETYFTTRLATEPPADEVVDQLFNTAPDIRETHPELFRVRGKLSNNLPSSSEKPRDFYTSIVESCLFKYDLSGKNKQEQADIFRILREVAISTRRGFSLPSEVREHLCKYIEGELKLPVIKFRKPESLEKDLVDPPAEFQRYRKSESVLDETLDNAGDRDTWEETSRLWRVLQEQYPNILAYGETPEDHGDFEKEFWGRGYGMFKSGKTFDEFRLHLKQLKDHGIKAVVNEYGEIKELVGENAENRQAEDTTMSDEEINSILFEDTSKKDKHQRTVSLNTALNEFNEATSNATNIITDIINASGAALEDVNNRSEE